VGKAKQIDLTRLCACGHERERHNGAEHRGRCWHVDNPYSFDAVACECWSFKHARPTDSPLLSRPEHG
jgi:hypothetical protein